MSILLLMFEQIVIKLPQLTISIYRFIAIQRLITITLKNNLQIKSNEKV
jgi:hypothetical protein